MFKTLSVSIGNTPFLIEEHAYAVLDRYLQSIRAHFASLSDADEIVSDIESRMAEEFTSALGKHRTVVEKKDVDAVIATMGTVEDFRKFEEGQSQSESHEHPFKKIRLYRDADNQILGGVCAGIANYFGIDPIIIRFAFGISIFLGGFGVVLYILLWVILPEARTTAEKVEMTGGRVTLSAIQQRIDEVVPPAKRKSILAKIVAFPFQVIGAVLRGLGRFLSVVLPFLGRIIGAILALAAGLAIGGLTFVLFALLLNPNSPYIGLPIHEVVRPMIYVTLLLSAYFVAFMPVLFVLLVGSSLLSRRNALSTSVIITMVSVWFVAGVTGSVTVFSVGPQLQPVLAQYDATSEKTFDLKDFQGIAADGIDRIEVEKGSYAVTMVAGKRGLSSHEVVVENGILSLRSLPMHETCLILCMSSHAVLRVRMPSVVTVQASDASRITLAGFSGSAMTMTTEGISRIAAEVALTDLTINMKDASRIELSGSAKTVVSTLQDISRINGEEFIVQDATVFLRDISRVILDVRHSLKGSAKDASRVEYLSAPTTVDVDVSDAATVEGREEWGEH